MLDGATVLEYLNVLRSTHEQTKKRAHVEKMPFSGMCVCVCDVNFVR